MRDVVQRELRRVAWGSERVRAMVREGVAKITEGTATPYSVAEGIVATLIR